MKTVAYLYL